MTTNIYTLPLKKETIGYYTTQSGPIEIVVSNPFKLMGEGSKNWQITITVNGDEVINAWTKTKKQATQVAIDWLTE